MTGPLSVKVEIYEGSVLIAAGTSDLRNLTDDEVIITTGNLAYGLMEEAYGNLSEELE